MTDEQRFMAKVEKADNGCWNWTGFVDAGGYGHFSIGVRWIRAHRASLVLFRRLAVEQRFVCHHCDNRRCVNPDHLYVGSAKTNNGDTLARGRVKAGSDATQAKLTPGQVLALRAKYARGLGYKRLADMFGISRSSARAICRGESYR